MKRHDKFKLLISLTNNTFVLTTFSKHEEDILFTTLNRNSRFIVINPTVTINMVLSYKKLESPRLL